MTLLTDFGTRDHFVAVLKGVIASVAPQVRVVDVTHDIGAQDVRAAAVVLEQVWHWYPSGTVHLAVVDPGVGSPRRILAGSWDGRLIVAPDNGVISRVQARRPAERLHEVTQASWFLPRVSRTFHGRDIMAPVAARLAAGADLGDVGPALSSPVMLTWPAAQRRDTRVRGEVLFVDRFGNLISNIPAADLEGPGTARIRIGGRTVTGISDSYAAVPAGQLVALISSLDTLEIAVNQGSAAEHLGVKAGAVVTCEHPRAVP